MFACHLNAFLQGRRDMNIRNMFDRKVITLAQFTSHRNSTMTLTKLPPLVSISMAPGRGPSTSAAPNSKPPKAPRLFVPPVSVFSQYRPLSTGHADNMPPTGRRHSSPSSTRKKPRDSDMPPVPSNAPHLQRRSGEREMSQRVLRQSRPRASCLLAGGSLHVMSVDVAETSHYDL